MADATYQIATYTQTCVMKGRIDWDRSTGPGLDGIYDEEMADVDYEVGTAAEIIENNRDTLKVLQGVQCPNAAFSIKRAINVLDFFDAFPDEDEGE
tara:strand:+ start:902 stop:1189 length:288 start_codon:yes stop_codon:yes gene_type:complete